MTDRKNYDEQLSAIMNGAADSILELSEEELIAEEREAGIDPNKEAERIRDVLRRASKMHRLRRLKAAEHVYHEHVRRLKGSQHLLPDSPKKRRELLAAVFASKPDMRPLMLTAQHRNFDQLTDGDVESFLKQLAELGILDSFEPNKPRT
jgi:hypothetical protein